MKNTDVTGPTPAITIMVVDDTPTNLELLEQMLLQRQYRVVCFPEGKLALEAAQRQKPDLILLDINMPEMNGYQVCQALKANPEFAEIPVIFISAISETLDKIKAFSLGGVDYVTKPFQVEEVIARVETHIKIQTLQKDLKSKYEQMQELEKWRDTLVTMLVHDMRSPLTALLGWTDLFAQNADAIQEPLREGVDTMHRTVLNLTSMVSDILDVSKMTDRKMVLHIEKTPIADTVKTAVHRLLNINPNKPLQVNLPPEAITIRCDRELLERVLINIIDNALKHGPNGNPISITATRSDSQVRFEVHDHGMIPEQFRPKLFDKFAQGHQPKGTRRGTGLGLAFCKMAVESHGGAIGADSDPGIGTTFWFTLPIEPELPPAGNPEETKFPTV